MKVAVSKIKWCIEREDVEDYLEDLSEHVTTPDPDEYIEELKKTLPTEVVLDVDDEDEIADTLSDKYGWLVESFEYDWREK